MSEKTEYNQDKNPVESQKDLVGDTLRKERITRRITVETIAKDLKINVKYIKALEANDYNALPADPYVRVYLKSLSKYLTLDSNEILKQFYKERGLTIEPSPKDTSTRIEISMKRKEESKNPLFIIAIILIILLAVFSFVAKKQGWLNAPPPTPSAQSVDEEFTDTESSADTVLADSLIPVTPPQETDTPATVNDETSEIPLDTTNMIHLSLTVVKDSVWIQVFSDGASWKNIIYKNQSRQFAARDSFNIHVGNLAAVKFTFNGKRMPMLGRGVFAFKVDRSGAPKKWTLTKWNNVFKDRI
jgi:cytoskeletal protein RodZ